MTMSSDKPKENLSLKFESKVYQIYFAYSDYHRVSIILKAF